MKTVNHIAGSCVYCVVAVAFALSPLVLTSPALAKTYEIAIDEISDDPSPEEVKTQSKMVESFIEGDEVIIKTSASGKVLHRFTLGRFINQGRSGRVFYEANSIPPKIVKFALLHTQTRLNMRHEVKAMKKLHALNIPAPKVYASHPLIFIQKDFISGLTLEKTIANWDLFSESERELRLSSLAILLLKLQRRSRLFDDIMESNIMFDELASEWKVTDPGTYFWGRKPNVFSIYSFLRRKGRETFFDPVKEYEQYIRANKCLDLRVRQSAD